jgi:hypothetical protein
MIKKGELLFINKWKHPIIGDSYQYIEIRARCIDSNGTIKIKTIGYIKEGENDFYFKPICEGFSNPSSLITISKKLKETQEAGVILI